MQYMTLIGKQPGSDSKSMAFLHADHHIFVCPLIGKLAIV